MRSHPAIELGLVEIAQSQSRLAQRGAFMVRSLCDFSRAVVPDMRCQRGDKHQRAIKQFGQALRPRLDSRCTMMLEARTTVGQQAQALQKGVGDHRL